MHPIQRTYALSVPILGAASFVLSGWAAYLVAIEAFVLIPALEFLLRGRTDNAGPEEEQRLRADGRYTALLYLTGLAHLGLFAWYLWGITAGAWAGSDLLGRSLGMGFSCGVLAINIGHELGHRRGASDRGFAQLLLWSSAYAHFYVEHNRGHHAKVATPEDPASARYGEDLYHFTVRSVFRGMQSAWHLEARRLARHGRSAWNWRNQALLHFALQLASWALLYSLAGGKALVLVVAVQFIGIALLEAVNYIEHYGLLRNQRSDGRYESVAPHHSWSTNRPLGRAILFDLTRHSDHHTDARRPYQVLRHHETAALLPTGYSGAILLALLPPLWFKLMNPRVQKLRALHGPSLELGG